ncbi:MAG: hypothetical protein QOD29_5926 [Alphaproteobacteria bacterium]|jgi:hypothetical protein|nr:hypothetical protein [Alphaproteobacteria bacterium]
MTIEITALMYPGRRRYAGLGSTRSRWGRSGRAGALAFFSLRLRRRARGAMRSLRTVNVASRTMNAILPTLQLRRPEYPAENRVDVFEMVVQIEQLGELDIA